MENISKLIEIFDNYLLQNNRSFIGLRTGNELIRNSNDEEIRNIDLKKTLELGLIPNSTLINTTKRQWRIYLSKTVEEKLSKELENEDFEKNFTYNPKSSISSADLVKEQKENGIKVLLVTCMLAFIYFVFINPQKNNDKPITTSTSTYSNKNLHQESGNQINPHVEKFFFFKTSENIKVDKLTGEVIQTNYETCYLTFDFNNNRIKIKAPLLGEWTTSEYKILNSSSRNYEGDEVFFLDIYSKGIQQVWINPQKNLIGYDYDDGSRIICYKLERIE